jgi:penicillin-binding protein 2
MAVKDINQDRQYIIVGVFILSALVLLGRAAQLQLFDPSYRMRADAATIERDVLYPSRGVIYDRHGKLMVYNNAMYDLMVTYKQVDKNMDTAKFCRLLDIDTATFRLNLEKDFKHDKRFDKNVPFPFLTMITPEQYTRFQESLHEFPGFEVKVRNVRGYPQHNAGHLLGYLSEVNDKMLKDSTNIYETGDYYGATGLERYYEWILRGQKGARYILKDNRGRLVGAHKNGAIDTKAVEGKDLLSTIDLRLQALAERMMTGKIGSIVAIEPKTGEILAMVTSPTFDPERMVISKGRGNFIASLYKDSLKPLFDRSVSARYPPGSIFKPMLAAIALQMGVWNKNNGMGCNGGYYYNNLHINCHSHGGVGNLADAIEHSCNNYFCTLYRAIVDQYGFRKANQGLDTLNAFMNRFGMGKKLELDFPQEKAGFLPNSTFYDKMYRRDKVWYSTNIVSNGIGQGENQLTTIQMANLAAIIANRGWYITPHLVRGYRDSTATRGYTVINNKTVEKKFTGVDAFHFEPIINGMRQVIESGTGSNARVSGIAVCGKTGTSQNPHGDDSSVFIGFAPQHDPQIAIAVYVENGYWGNDYAAPMTSLLTELYLRGEIPKSREYLVEKMERSRYAHSSGRGYYVRKGY